MASRTETDAGRDLAPHPRPDARDQHEAGEPTERDHRTERDGEAAPDGERGEERGESEHPPARTLDPGEDRVERGERERDPPEDGFVVHPRPRTEVEQRRADSDAERSEADGDRFDPTEGRVAPRERRMRHPSPPTAAIATTNPATIHSRVSSPSPTSVRASTGMRRNAGTGPKYMYSLWSCWYPSTATTRNGMSQRPSKSRRACTS